MGRPIHEKGKHLAAFEFYYVLGADRALSAVARRFKTSVQSVHCWNLAFGWQKRIAEREKVVADLVAQKSIEDEAQSRSDALKICRAVQVRFAQSLQNQTAQIGAGDFDKAVKLELLLRGRATDRTEIVDGPEFDKLIDALAAVIEREVKDPELRQRLANGIAQAAASIGG